LFGTYRTLLATLVIFLHLGGMPVIGSYAVFGFYILSGYLMTLIMQNSYGYTKYGIARYALNRFLRIYPIYWISCIISLLLIFLLGEDVVRNFHGSIYYPANLGAVLRNVFLIFPSMDEPRLTPPSWALTVEIFYYICIGLGFSKTRRLTITWLAVSILYAVIVNATGADWNHKYFTIPAASLPFATGAMLFHYKRSLADVVERSFSSTYLPLLLVVLILVNWLAGYLLGTLRGFSFYVNFLLCALVLVTLLEKTSLPFISRKVDRMLGDFSYPVYLVHYQVGLVVLVVADQAGYSLQRPGTLLMLASLPFIFLTAWLMTRFVELPIEVLRSRIKADKVVVGTVHPGVAPARTELPVGKSGVQD